VSASERRVVARYALGLFLVSFASALGTNVALGLVLERWGAAGLPSLVMMHAALLSLTTLVAARYARAGVARWLTVALALGAVLVGACGALDAAGARWAVGALYVGTNVLGDVAAALFWVMANQVFDMRAAKRVSPRIAAGGTTGAALAGLLAPVMMNVAGVRGLLAILAVVLAAAAGWSLPLARSSARGPARVVAARPRRAAPPGREDAALVRAIVLGVVVVGAATLFGRYLYARALEQAFAGDASTIVAKNGLLTGIASVLTTLTQLFVTPALIERFGVRVAMGVYPAAMIGVFAALAGWFGLGTGVLAHFATSVLRKGVHAPVEGVLPTALSSEQTSRALLLATAVGTPAGMLLGGAALRLGRAWSSEALAEAGLVVSIGLLAIGWWRARAYAAALRLALRKGGSELRLRMAGQLGRVRDVRAALAQELDPLDPALLARLTTLVLAQREAERSGERIPLDAAALDAIIERRIAAAYRLRAALDRLVYPDTPRGLAELWRRAIEQELHDDIRIVLFALRAATGHADLDRITPRLFDLDQRARGAALEILEAVCPGELRPLVVPLIEGVDLEKGRLAASARFGPPADDPILDLLEVPNAWLRAITIYALASLGPGAYRARIEALSGSQDPWLRLACARALEAPAGIAVPLAT
jgi:hypothetical protein